MKKNTIVFALIFSFVFVFAEPDTNVETLPETSQNEQKTKKKSEIKWKFYSKNKAHVFLDQTIRAGEEKDNYAVIQTEDLGEVTYKNYTFGVRKTLLFFADKESDDSVRNFDYVYSDEHFNHCWEQYLDRLYMKGKWKNIQFTAGDFYESMNRGMAFSMKNDQVYGDNSIRGGNIAGNYNSFFIKAFGGRANPQLRDSATFKRMNESDDWLAGMEAGYKWKIAEAAVQYGYGNYGKYDLYNVNKETTKKNISAEKEFHFIGSYVALKNPFPGFSFYAGAVYVPYGYENTTATTQIKENAPAVDKEKKDLQNAAAFYSSALYYFDFGEKKSRLTFKLEGKMYNKFFLNYNRMEDADYQKRRYFNPPTLLPKELQIDNEFDTWAVGGRISFNENYSGIKFHADLVKGDSLGNKDSLPVSKPPNLILDYQAEDFWYSALSGEKEWQHVSLSAGIGWHTVDGNSDRRNSRDWIISFIHVGGFVSDFSMKLNNDYYHKDYWFDDTHKMNDVHELKTVAEVSWKYKRTHELFAAVKNTTWVEKKDNGEDSYVRESSFYPGGSIGYKYKFLRTYVFGGLERGGFTCDGGTCRYLPDFKGVKAEIEINL